MSIMIIVVIVIILSITVNIQINNVEQKREYSTVPIEPMRRIGFRFSHDID
jgi:hypothetical protein